MSRRADSLAHEQMAHVGIFPEPPIDVFDLARRLGVAEIRPAPLVEDGRLDVTPHSIRILVRGDLSPTRRRFTIAHEIAHLIIGEGAIRIDKRYGTPRDTTERLCDQIAAGILLPYRWVADHYSGRSVSLATVRELAQKADVSMGAAVVRLQEVAAWHYSLLRWRRQDAKWRFVAGTGLPPNVFGSVRTAPETVTTLDEIARSTHADVRTQLPVILRGDLVRARSEVSLWGRTALALSDLMEFGNARDQRDWRRYPQSGNQATKRPHDTRK